jgi:polysaccharide export outer membrane protein
MQNACAPISNRLLEKEGSLHVVVLSGDLMLSGATYRNDTKRVLERQLPQSRAIRPVVAALLALAIGATVTGCTTSSASVDTAVPASVETAQYIIGPGDRLSIFVYDNPQLSIADLPVRPDGRISTPLVSDVDAAGKTPAQLATVFSERLKKFVKDPNVTIMVREFIGPFDRQVRVIGEAADPQAIAYSQHMTVLDVMIRTKGLTRFAAGNSALIVRTMPGQASTTLHVHLSDLIKNGDISQNVEMQPGDTLIIPQTWF